MIIAEPVQNAGGCLVPGVGEHFQGKPDDLGRVRRDESAADDAGRKLEVCGLNKLVEHGLQAGGEVPDLVVLGGEAAGFGGLGLLPGEELLGGVFGVVPVDGVVVDAAEQQEVHVAVELVAREVRVVAGYIK